MVQYAPKHVDEIWNKIYVCTNVFNFKKNLMGWACSAYGWGEGGVEGLDGETGGKETTGVT